MENNKKYCLVTLKYTILDENEKGKRELVDGKTEKIILSDTPENLMDRIHLAEDSLSGKGYLYHVMNSNKVSKYLYRHAELWKKSYYNLLNI